MKKWNGIGKEHSLIARAILRFIVAGFISIFLGISNCFDPIENAVTETILSCTIILFLVFAILLKFEEDDEMSKAHLNKALAKGCLFTLLLACLTSIGCFIGDYFGHVLSVRLSVILPVMVGISFVSSGVLFIKYERKGTA